MNTLLYERRKESVVSDTRYCESSYTQSSIIGCNYITLVRIESRCQYSKTAAYINICRKQFRLPHYTPCVLRYVAFSWKSVGKLVDCVPSSGADLPFSIRSSFVLASFFSRLASDASERNDIRVSQSVSRDILTSLNVSLACLNVASDKRGVT